MKISGGVAGDADAVARSGAVGVVDGATPVSMDCCKDRNATSVGATSSAAVCAEIVDVNDFVAKVAADDGCCGSFSMAMQPAISLVMSSSPLMLKLFERQLSANDSLRSSSLKLPSSREVEEVGGRMAELDASRAPDGDRDGADREAKRHGDDEQGGDEADDDGDEMIDFSEYADLYGSASWLCAQAAASTKEQIGQTWKMLNPSGAHSVDIPELLNALRSFSATREDIEKMIRVADVDMTDGVSSLAFGHSCMPGSLLMHYSAHFM